RKRPSRARFMSLTWPATAAPLVAAPLPERVATLAMGSSRERRSRMRPVRGRREVHYAGSASEAQVRRDLVRECHMLLHMKRTTLILDAAIYAELKRRAAREGRTLTEVVEHALRMGLGPSPPGRRGRLRIPSYDMGPFLMEPEGREP